MTYQGFETVSDKNSEERPMGFWAKRRLLKSIKAGLREYENGNNLILTAWENGQRLGPGLRLDDSFVNITNFYYIYLFDVLLVTRNIVNSKSPLEQKHYEKALILAIHSGSQFLKNNVSSKTIEHLQIDEASREKIKSIGRRLHHLTEEFNAEFKPVRNAIVAHHDRSLDIRIQMYGRLDSNRILDFSQRIMSQLEALTRLFEGYLNFYYQKIRGVETEMREDFARAPKRED